MPLLSVLLYSFTPISLRLSSKMASVSNAFHTARKSFNGRLIGPYQSQGVSWMLNREINGGHVRGGFLCDEMGLGKTAQTAAMMLGNPVPKTLIVVPKSIVSQWVTELKRFAPQAQGLCL